MHTSLKDEEFKLILVDLQPNLIEELKKSFNGLPNVEFVCGRFERLPEFHCMVSAANSFGLMDGGVDAAITVFFGDQLQKRVQQRILDEFDGEQPIGTSFIVSTRHEKHPYLAHTPTMRVPMSIQGTDYVYLAMKAMLPAIKDHNISVKNGRASDNDTYIKSVACTGLGTFYGKMSFDEAARQMALAYRNFLKPPKKISWSYASQRQREVRYGGFDGLRLEAVRQANASSSEVRARQSRMEVATQIMDTHQCNIALNKQEGKDRDEDEDQDEDM